MPGLLLILTAPAGGRFEAAVELAAASAALGRPVALLLRGEAVAALGAGDGGVTRALALLGELGAGLWACQTAMAAHGLKAGDLPPGVGATGMVALLQGRADWQLLLA